MNVLTKIEAQPLTFADLKRMLGEFKNTTHLIKYDDLAKVESMRDLHKDASAVIILLSIETPNAPKVGHWVATLDHGDHYEHFDSYGLSADKELSITHEKPYLSNLLGKADKHVVDSGVRFQTIREHINTCGRWCVARVRLQEMNLKDFKHLINQSHTVPDATVALMTMFL